MRINTNISAMNAWRTMSSVDNQLAKSMERLSSGLRVNRASDDAAGLSISENLNAQVRGQRQAMRNVQDGLSALRIADGGLNEIHAALQRMRELAVQAANSTYTAEQRQVIQDETTALASEIDAIAQNTTFNGIPLLSASRYSEADRQTLLTMLQQSILKDGYDAVMANYGFSHNVPAAPGDDLVVVFSDDIAGGTVAFVRGSLGPLHNPGTMELHIDLSWWIPLAQSGTPADIDRMENVMAHEMTHALMFDETNMASFTTWFVEGTAEFLTGADDRVNAELAALGGDVDALVSRLSNTGWGGGSADYAAGYLAVKYLDEQLRANPTHPGGIADLMANGLDDTAMDMEAIAVAAGYTAGGGLSAVDDFLADFKANASSWVTSSPYVDLAGGDNGGVNGSDYGGAARTTATAVATSGSTADPTGWLEVWPTTASTQVILQTGANNGEELTLNLTSVTSGSLGVGSLDLVGSAGAAITAIDEAIAQISSTRGTLGAQANQLEHTFANLGTSAENQAAAYSRIRDHDMAAGMTTLTRQQILLQSAQGMLAQANMKDAGILELLS